jgi:ankyrin repeat protein
MNTFPDIVSRIGIRKLNDLIAAGVNLEEKDDNGRTALFRVCRSGNIDKTKLLINAGADPNAIDKKFCETPLHSAARRGNLDCVHALIEAGATIDYCTPASFGGYSETALCGAAGKCSETARFLLSVGADPNVTSDAKNYPLFSAIYGGNYELVPLLIKNGASVNIRSLKEETPLHVAVDAENGDVVKVLINAGADVNARDKRGETPAFFIAGNLIDSIVTLEPLLAAGPNLSIKSLHWDQHPLERALFCDNDNIAELLRNAGAPPAEKERQESVFEFHISHKLAAEDLSEQDVEIVNLSADQPENDLESVVYAQESKLTHSEDRKLKPHYLGKDWKLSKPHKELLRHSHQVLSLKRMTYFARGYLNAKEGCELDDGMKVLGEPYETATEYFVNTGLLERIDGPEAIIQTFTKSELINIAKRNGLSAYGKKLDLVKMLFTSLGPLPFSERLKMDGGYFKLTKHGIEECRAL